MNVAFAKFILTTMLIALSAPTAFAAGAIDCDSVVGPWKNQAEKCLNIANPMSRFMCVNPIRNAFAHPAMAACKAMITQYQTAWDSREHVLYKRNLVTITGNADPEECRSHVNRWASTLMKCANNPKDKFRAKCAETEEESMLTTKKTCFLPQHRILSLVEMYEGMLYPNRAPAMMTDGPVIVLKPARKGQ